jgi:hypothetical protein
MAPRKSALTQRLETELATAKHELAAAHEWFTLTQRAAPPIYLAITLDWTGTGDDTRTILVTVLGPERMCGGVAIVTDASPDYPRFLGGLIVDWQRSPYWELREAAVKLQRIQTDAVSKVG